MSKSYTLNAALAEQIMQTGEEQALDHCIAIEVVGTSIAGTLSVYGKFPGGTVFELVPDAFEIPLDSPYSVQFGGPVHSYKFVLAGVSGITELTVTDTTGGEYD